MNMKTIALTGAAMALLTTGAPAAPSATMTMTKHTALICPITGTKIATAAKAYNHEVYKGKTYYFCCPQCKPAFDKDPAKAIADAAQGKYQKM